MARSEFQGILKPRKDRFPVVVDALTFFVKDLFTIRALLLTGALLQIITLSVLPARYALWPTFLLLLQSIGSTIFYTIWPKYSPCNKNVLYNRTSAQFPAASYDPRSHTPYGSQPSRDGVVVFHLGARFNHPLGALSPGGKDIKDHFDRLNKELGESAKEYGCLGWTDWRGSESSNNNTFLSIYYFRDIEGLNAFAHAKTHRDTWDWYNRAVTKLGYKHIGIYHEAFYSAPGKYETIYVNIPPVLLGNTSVPTRNEETGEDEWIRPLVDAEIPALRTQFQRMGRDMKREEGGTVSTEKTGYHGIHSTV